MSSKKRDDLDYLIFELIAVTGELKKHVGNFDDCDIHALLTSANDIKQLSDNNSDNLLCN